jgi:RNA polymerase sigma-70 factor, ECF subfamily
VQALLQRIANAQAQEYPAIGKGSDIRIDAAPTVRQLWLRTAGVVDNDQAASWPGMLPGRTLPHLLRMIRFLGAKPVGHHERKRNRLRLTMDRLPRLDDADAVELLRRIRDGDEEAFATLFRCINRRVFLFARHRLGDREAAEEVLNDTALELWQHPDRYRGDARFMTYVLGIANNRALSLLRGRGRYEQDPGDDLEGVPDEGPTPFDALWRKQKLAAIERCMELLSKHLRTIVHLAYFEDLSRAEIGNIVCCSENAVRQHLFHALRKMTPCLAASELQ